MRSFVSGVLVLLTVLAALVTVPARYVENTVLDTAAYVRATAPLGEQAPVQDAVAEALTGAVTSQVDSGALSAAIRPVVGEVAKLFVRSDSFPSVWTEANRQGHAAAVAVLRDEGGDVDASDGVVTVPLDPFLERIGQSLRDRGLPVSQSFATTGREIVLYDSTDLRTAQEAVSLLDRVTPWLLPAVLILAAAAVLIARAGRRLPTAVVTAGLVAVAMLLLQLLVPVAAELGLVGLDVGSGQAVLDGAVDALLAPLRTQLWWAFGIAGVLCVGFGVTAAVTRRRRAAG